ncbi:hypothetical protein [Fusobacterium animalis]|uniref:hypothetical protein n=1 Tax=Fusobacterium animalis TaxID=76859 RepID=UPI0030D152CF
MEFHNYLINEKFLRDKEKELFYIEFLNNDEYSKLGIDYGINTKKIYFVIGSSKEQFYENDKTLLTLYLPLNVKEDGKDLNIKLNLMNFLKRWYYEKNDIIPTLELTNIKINYKNNIFNSLFPLTKENFFYEGIEDNSAIFRILINHKF